MIKFFPLFLVGVMLALTMTSSAQYSSRVIGTLNVDALQKIVDLSDLGPTWVPAELKSDTLQLRDMNLNVVSEIIIGSSSIECCDFGASASVDIMPQAGRQEATKTEFVVSFTDTDGVSHVEVYGIDGELVFSSSNEAITPSNYMILEPPLFDETSLLLGGTVNGERHVAVYSLPDYQIVREKDDCVAYAMPNFPNQPVALVGSNEWTGLTPNLLFNGTNDLFAVANSYQKPFEQDWGLDGEFDFARVLRFGTNDFQLEVKSANSTIHVSQQVLGVTGSTAVAQYSNVHRPSSNNFPVTLIRFFKTNGDRLNLYYNTAAVESINFSDIVDFDQFICVNDTEYLYRNTTTSRRILYDINSGDSIAVFPYSIGYDTTQIFYNQSLGSCVGQELFDINYAYSGDYEGERKIFFLDSQFEVNAYVPLNRLYRTFTTSTNKMFYYTFSNRDRGVVDVYEILDRSLSVEDFANGLETKFYVFPNPANEHVELLLEDGQLHSAIVLDATGRLVKGLTHEELQRPVSLNGFLPGLYFINARSSDGKVYNTRLLVSSKHE